MNGYTGKLLFVNLTTGEISTQDLNRAYAAQYLGGSGLAARYLYDWLEASTDPLGPDNPLVFMNGPLDGTGAPSSGRFAVCARSPQTGLWGEAIAGNFFGPELKFAGYDGIVLRGRANALAYLHITPDGVEIRAANHLRGMTTYDAGDCIRAELNDPNLVTACIGPAGENLVKYALILASSARPGAKKGIAGRCGMGAVMGSKNLKAIAIRGSKHHRSHKLDLHDPARFRQAMLRAQKFLSDDMSTEIWRAVGTSGTIDFLGLLGDVPVKYWTQGSFDYSKISGNLIAETILTGRGTCHACMVACGRKVEKAGAYVLPHAEGPEYETLASFGSLMLVDDVNVLSHLGAQCDALGVDSISAGSTIAFAMYLRELGLVPDADLNGTRLQWCDPEGVLTLLNEIVHKEKFGALLAEGTQALGAHYGVEGMAVQVNGMEVAMHDPRAASGMAITYATSPIGASHNQSDFFMVETSGRPIDELGIETVDRFQTEGKMVSLTRHQEWRTVNNALVLCYFPNPPAPEICEMLAAATGYDISTQNVLTYGERIWNLKRALNLKLGYNARGAEKLPELLLRPLAEGGAEGHVPDFETMLREYYHVRDWDWATGKPSHAKLNALGMSGIAQDVWLPDQDK
ncbi:MAG: aldehyde ferredoxin oxidoreductase family protein [Chloroflexi bacterium]|nr:aldehyde ferredoxin oxidoreductase family protein [Chloroflexota bacterium]